MLANFYFKIQTIQKYTLLVKVSNNGSNHSKIWQIVVVHCTYFMLNIVSISYHSNVSQKCESQREVLYKSYRLCGRFILRNCAKLTSAKSYDVEITWIVLLW